MGKQVYVNGSFCDREEASVDIEDRGYQFADAVYEVIYFSNGEPFRMKEHIDRLRESAKALHINLPDLEQLREDARTLQEQNDIQDGKLYIQVSRGIQKRGHAYDEDLEPSVVMTLQPFEGHPETHYREGVEAITVSDDRWAKCYIKTTALISNVLAKTKAKKQGVFEAIFVRDGFVTEGTSSNVFVVRDGTVRTPPASNYILNGVTRRVVIDLIRSSDVVELSEEAVSADELFEADEVVLTGTTTEVMPVVAIDGRTIGSGSPGEVSQVLLEAYRNELP